ncbi:response regulator transcription factor [Noviherbaspirillum galbum]|uniref:Response regulator transcription factor n=1 Tax=Noviherbaspirillum galbum TaxID=2709383 RepID=A0A6B3SLU2_9BURK|nr:response regulator transcription factor [Noviherbaspirillum galbum]NEX60335.1 response regulator transcription factor [Noviherbaspirillum galbum]
MRILLVEDTDDVAQAIVTKLSGIGHTVDRAADGTMAAGMMTGEYDLIILDVMLPGLDGFTLLSRLRDAGRDTKVLMLTACGEVDERVRALDAGADDYLMKPFDYRELEARVRVLLRRTGGDATNMLACANLTIDRKSRAAALDGLPLDLTRREVTLLEILASRPGRIFGKEELVDRLFTIDDNPSANAIEQYVARLRKKLGAAQFEIRTLRGLGYQLALK